MMLAPIATAIPWTSVCMRQIHHVEQLSLVLHNLRLADAGARADQTGDPLTVQSQCSVRPCLQVVHSYIVRLPATSSTRQIRFLFSTIFASAKAGHQ